MDYTLYVDSVSFLVCGRVEGFAKARASRKDSTMSMFWHACRRVKRESNAFVKIWLGLHEHVQVARLDLNVFVFRGLDVVHISILPCGVKLAC